MNDYALYAPFYDWQTKGLPGDVDFYVEEAQRVGSPVLELGCGSGRVLLPTAEAGLEIVGLDNSPEMLALARTKLSQLPAETQARVQFIEADIRDFHLGRTFKLITIPLRSFLHLHTPTDQRQALACIHEHLADDGRLIFNLFDPRAESLAQYKDFHGSSPKRVGEFVHPETGRKFLLWASLQYDLEAQLMEQLLSFEELDDQNRVLSKTYIPIKLRFVHRYEMQYLLEVCGFTVEALFGDFKRGPFKYGSEQIWVARKT